MRIACIFFLFSTLDTFIFVHGSCDHYWHTLYLFSLYVVVWFFHLSLHVLFLFFLYTHSSYYLYAIYYFCLIQRCLNKFCLRCFRNIGCLSLLAINSLLAKFFKSLYYDRFYCIQQVSMSWVIYDFSHIFICLLWFCHGLPKGEIVKTYVIHLLGTYVTILCNWLIFWQNALYLYLGRTMMCLILQETLFQDQELKPCKSDQDSSLKSICH